MLKIGAVLFTIGLLLISPLDDILFLIPLSLIVGVWVFPVFIAIALICLIVGGILIGKHLLPVLSNPIILVCSIVAILIGIYCVLTSGWINF